jgi:hypothetical protein
LNPNILRPGSITEVQPVTDFTTLSNKDESTVYKHRIEAIAEDLEQAVNACWPHRTTRYASVNVLLLRWEEDFPPSTVTEDMEELFRVFSEDYRYNVKIDIIPTEGSARWLNRTIMEFSDQDDSTDILKILYYGGPSFVSDSGESMWTR